MLAINATLLDLRNACSKINEQSPRLFAGRKRSLHSAPVFCHLLTWRTDLGLVVPRYAPATKYDGSGLAMRRGQRKNSSRKSNYQIFRNPTPRSMHRPYRSHRPHRIAHSSSTKASKPPATAHNVLNQAPPPQKYLWARKPPSLPRDPTRQTPPLGSELRQTHVPARNGPHLPACRDGAQLA